MVGAVTVFLLISASAGQNVRVRGSPVSCSSQGVECDYNSTNLINTVTHVSTLRECRQMCLDIESCRFISYYDDNAVPVSHYCLLFTSCETVTHCSDCTSENMQCFESCGSNIVGDLDENILDSYPLIEDELACLEICHRDSECAFYTYFFATDPLYHQNCFLLTEFLHPSQPCDTCVTGPVECSNSCVLEINGEFYSSLMLTNTSETLYVTVNGLGACKLNFLAVGGGGSYVGNTYAGAGSGYLQYRSLEVDPGTVISTNVGALGESSTVAIINGESFTAEAGEDAQGTAENSIGGAGYSGGGSGARDPGTAYDGGTDGGNGGGGGGGAGTGEDISSYILNTWSLSPAPGGEAFDCNNYGDCAGGGGGVLLDGSGPDTAHTSIGQGFGGGGANGGAGHQGIILMEITSV